LEELQRRNYSQETTRSYIHAVKQFAGYFGKSPQEFDAVTLRNGDIQAGNLRDKFDAIVLPDSNPDTILNGFGPGSVPGGYVGGIEEFGVMALREFVLAEGTLITFNNASLFAIDQLGLPVKNVLAGLKHEEFSARAACCGLRCQT
jgi:hypothetical protein